MRDENVAHIETRVEEVVLYSDGAHVVRTGVAVGGWNQVQDLPLSMLSDGLVVRPAFGSIIAREDVCAVSIVAASFDPDKEGKMVKAKASLAALQHQLQQLTKWDRELQNTDISLQQREYSEVESPAVEHWTTFDDALLRERDKVQQGIRAIRLDVEGLQQKINILAKGIQLPAQAPNIMRGIRFLLDDDVKEVPFRIEYSVGGACWVPSYRLDLRSDDDKVAHLRMMALCANASGEDWSGAELSLSTSEMNMRVAMPELFSWRLGRAQESVRPAFREPPQGVGALFASYDLGTQHALPVSSSATSSLPPSSSPPSSMLGLQEDDAFDDDEFDEFDEFDDPEELDEILEPAERMATEASMLMDMSSAIEDFEADEGAKMMMSRAMPIMAPSAPSAPSAPPAPKRMKKRRSFNGGGAFGGVGGAPTLDATWRHESLMLADAEDSSNRGKLVVHDDEECLFALLGHDNAKKHALRLALQESARVVRALQQGRRPQGTCLPCPNGTFSRFQVCTRIAKFPSDGLYHCVDVDDERGKATQELRSIPSSGEDVFRFCRLAETEKTTPRGPLAVFEDGVFVVQSEMLDEPGRSLREIGLGVEPGVRVKNRVVHVAQVEKGLMHAESHITHEVKFEVVATLKSIREVHLFERLPQPADDTQNLSVVLLGSTPEAKSTTKGPSGESVRAGLCWRLVLEPGSIQNVSYRYRISLPAKEEVLGGNRREH